MEEIGALFGDEVIVHLTADGRGILESDKLGAAMDDIPHDAVDVPAKDASKTAVHVEMRDA